MYAFDMELKKLKRGLGFFLYFYVAASRMGLLSFGRAGRLEGIEGRLETLGILETLYRQVNLQNCWGFFNVLERSPFFS